jgi:hypothetical protein
MDERRPAGHLRRVTFQVVLFETATLLAYHDVEPFGDARSRSATRRERHRRRRVAYGSRYPTASDGLLQHEPDDRV